MSLRLSRFHSKFIIVLKWWNWKRIYLCI